MESLSVQHKKPTDQPYFDLHHGMVAGNEFSVRNTPDLRSYSSQLLFYEAHRSSMRSQSSALVSFPDHRPPHKGSLGTRLLTPLDTFRVTEPAVENHRKVEYRQL